MRILYAIAIALTSLEAVVEIGEDRAVRGDVERLDRRGGSLEVDHHVDRIAAGPEQTAATQLPRGDLGVAAAGHRQDEEE